MLEGLEVAEVSHSLVAEKERLDAESVGKLAFRLAKRLGRKELIALEDVAQVSDGNHLSIASEFSDATGVRYLRGQDISGEMVLDDGNPVFIPDSEYDKLARSHIFKDDVLVTIVGANTGYTALVHEAPEKLTANCKLGIVRVKHDKAIEPAYLHTFLAGRYGQFQIDRAKRGGGQMGLILPDLKALKVPRLGKAIEMKVTKLSAQAYESRVVARTLAARAGTVLLRALGLENWQPPESLSYVRTSREAFSAGRLDAEHFQPKFAALLAHLELTGQAQELGAVLSMNQRGKQPDYAEGGLPVVNSKHVAGGMVQVDGDNRYADFDDQTLLIQPGDVLMNGTGVGTIGRCAPYLHESKAIPDNHVTILRPKAGLDPIYLSVFLNSQAGQLQVAQRLRGSSGQIELYPNDIAQFKVWLAPENVQKEIREAVVSSFGQKQRATQLLDAAKRAIEIAIEESEAAALAYLDGVEA